MLFDINMYNITYGILFMVCFEAPDVLLCFTFISLLSVLLIILVLLLLVVLLVLLVCYV